MARRKFVPVGEPEEGMEFTGPIMVGTGMTVPSGSDRRPYEVIAVRDQKHITVRALDHVRAGDYYTNDWELWSDDDLPMRDMIRIGDVWYWTWKDNGKARRSKVVAWFGRARYYYDYEF